MKCVAEYCDTEIPDLKQGPSRGYCRPCKRLVDRARAREKHKKRARPKLEKFEPIGFVKITRSTNGEISRAKGAVHAVRAELTNDFGDPLLMTSCGRRLHNMQVRDVIGPPTCHRCLGRTP